VKRRRKAQQLGRPKGRGKEKKTDWEKETAGPPFWASGWATVFLILFPT